MKRLSLLLPALALALALATPASAHEEKGSARMTEPQLREGMRKLWEDHVTYTAFFCTAVINGGDDAGKLAERLLRNQDDIGNAVKPFYGEGAGNKLSALLRDHILVAADLVGAAKAGNAAAQEQATKRRIPNLANRRSRMTSTPIPKASPPSAPPAPRLLLPRLKAGLLASSWLASPPAAAVEQRVGRHPG